MRYTGNDPMIQQGIEDGHLKTMLYVSDYVFDIKPSLKTTRYKIAYDVLQELQEADDDMAYIYEIERVLRKMMAVK